MNPVRDVSIQPVVSWHPDGSATSRIISVDLQLTDPAGGWPYDEEEFLVGCMIDGRPWCTVRALGSAGVVLHRFGGTYGPAYFRAELTDTSADLRSANLWLTLTTAGGVPFYTTALPLDGSGLRTSSRPVPEPRRRRTTAVRSAAPPRIVDDPDAPIFLFSYARPDRSRASGPPREPNRHMVQLFEDVSELVNELIGRPDEFEPGYLDRGRGSGESWQKSVLQAAGTAQVMVCLLSYPYLYSNNWGSREWDLFARRRVVSRGVRGANSGSAIVPVLWTPFEQPIPEPVAKEKLFIPDGLADADWQDRYLTDGLLGLLRTGQTEIYDSIVWKLAMHIQRIHGFYWVEPFVPDSVEGLRTSFTGETT